MLKLGLQESWGQKFEPGLFW